jgi:hypothetical protein
MIITVTQEHIDQALVIGYSCPICMAIYEYFPDLVDKNIWLCNLPQEAHNFNSDYREGILVKPFSFEYSREYIELDESQ